jgi:hypothetical protein
VTGSNGRPQELAAAVPARPGGVSPVIIALSAAFAFGSADQYLQVMIPMSAHLNANLFATQISGMSAPWLLVPFLAGAWQRSPRRAALVGLAATWLAVLAWVLMIVSPMEGTALRQLPHSFVLSLASQWRWFAGGLISGPLYGWLGYRWRARRSPLTALVATLPILLEPAYLWLTSRLGVSSPGARAFEWPVHAGAIAAEFTELAVGLLLTSVVIMVIARSRATTAA